MKPHWLKLGAFVALGAMDGFACYYFIGCANGACPIASNPCVSAGYGALMGAALGWERKPQSRRER